MKKMENFWEQRSQMFGNRIEGVLIKSVPKIINNYLDNWMLGQVSLIISREQSKVLDVGCGYGRLSMSLAKKFPKATFSGIDISQNYVELYNRNLALRGKAVYGRVQKLPFPSSYFDTVFMVTTLMYLTNNNDQKKAVREIFRVLKPGGNFIIIERSPLGYAIFTMGGLVSKLRGKKNSEIPAVSFAQSRLCQVITQSGGVVYKLQGIPIFTVFSPISLLLSFSNSVLGNIFLSFLGWIDKKLGWLTISSLYISYTGVKNG